MGLGLELEAAHLEARLLLVAFRLYAAAHVVALEGDLLAARVRLRVGVRVEFRVRDGGRVRVGS